MSSGIVLSSATRSSLLAAQDTAALVNTTQTRLATGKKVNSALDNATSFFTANSLDSRSSSLSSLLDSISNGVQTIQAANQGITSITKLVAQAKSIANQALQSSAAYTTKGSFTATAAITGASAGDLLGPGSGGAGTTQDFTFAAQTGATTFTLGGTTINLQNNVGTSSTSTAAFTALTSGQTSTFTVGGTSVTLANTAATASSATYAYTPPTGGNGSGLTIGGQSVTIADNANLATAVSTINAVSGIGVTASAVGGALVLTNNATGTTPVAAPTGAGATAIFGSAATATTTGSAAVATGSSASNAAAAITAALSAASNSSVTVAASGSNIVFTTAAHTATAISPTAVSGTSTFGTPTVVAGSADLGSGSTASNAVDAINAQLTTAGNATVTASLVSGKIRFTNTAHSSAAIIAPTGGQSSSLFTSPTSAVTGSADTVELLNKTLTVQVGPDATNTKTVTFGDGTGGTIKTLDQLNTALNTIGAQASLSSTGKLNVTTTNDSGAESLTVSSSSASLFSSTPATSTATLGGDGATTRNNLVTSYNALLTQIDQLAKDSSYNGVNLLNGDNLKLTFNEKNTSSLTVKGTTTDASSLGLTAVANTDFQDGTNITAVLANISAATDTLQSLGSSLGTNLSVVQNRQDFIKNIINVLDTGSSNLTSADLNEEAANSTALSTRQSLEVSSLSLANTSQQQVLRLLQ